MSEFVFPVSVTLLLYGVMVPLLTLVSRALLKRSDGHPHELGAWRNYVLIVAPVLLPAAAVLGAAAHQFDGHHAYQVCLSAHDLGEHCFEAALLIGLVLLPLVVNIRWRRRARKAGEASAALSDLGVEVRIVDTPTVCTRGYMRPWVEIGREVVETLGPDQVRAAVLHESAHARARDPFLTALGHLAIRANPLGFLLRPRFGEWQLGREIRCDLWAVSNGASRFDLADAMVAVAGWGRTRQNFGVSNLTGAAASLRLRVAVLLDANPPESREDRGILVAVGMGLLLVFGVFTFCELPFLDVLHLQSEHAFAHTFESPHHH